MAAEVRGRVWGDEELEVFLDLWASQEVLTKLDGTSRNTTVFNLISSKLTDMGFERTSKEIKNKMKNLKRDYKKTIDHNRRSGVARKTIPFQDKLEEILGDRPAAEPVQTFTSMDLTEAETVEAEIGTNDMSEDEQDLGLHHVDVATDNSSLDSDLDASTISKEQETSMAADVCSTPRATSESSTKKRPAADTSSEASSSKTPLISNRNAKKSRMRDTISLVADAFKLQMDRSEHVYREEMRRQQQEQENWEKQWRQQAAEEARAFNDTMKSFLGVVAGMMSSSQQQRPFIQQGHGQMYRDTQMGHPGPSTAPSWQHHEFSPSVMFGAPGSSSSEVRGTSHRSCQQNRPTRPTHRSNSSQSTTTVRPPYPTQVNPTQVNPTHANHILAPASTAPFPGHPTSSSAATEPHTAKPGGNSMNYHGQVVHQDGQDFRAL